ncbi:unnamed protein product [Arabidopsis halleri]
MVESEVIVSLSVLKKRKREEECRSREEEELREQEAHLQMSRAILKEYAEKENELISLNRARPSLREVSMLTLKLSSCSSSVSLVSMPMTIKT